MLISYGREHTDLEEMKAAAHTAGAVLTNAPILIPDEATSSVDTVTEQGSHEKICFFLL